MKIEKVNYYGMRKVAIYPAFDGESLHIVSIKNIYLYLVVDKN